MSNSPYAAAAGPSGYDEFQPTRTSVLAVLAVVCAILCLPPTGLLAILLGAISLSAIGRSKGRIEGRGAAISAIILGLITTVLWGAIAMGVLQGWTYYTKNLVSTGDRFFQAASARDYDALRAELTVEAAEVTDEQLDWFFAEIESREGEVIGASTTFNTMFNSFGAVFGSSRGKSQQNFTVQSSHEDDDVPVPVAVQCANGSVIAWCIFDHESLENLPESTPKIVDILVQFASDEVVTMRNGGPAAEAARQALNQAPIVNPEGESEEAPDAPPEREPDADEPSGGSTS